MYTTYDFYKYSYKGYKFSDHDDKFLFYEQMASAKLKSITRNRITELTDDVQLCTCELMDYLKDADKMDGGMVASESLGNHSISYTHKTHADMQKDMNNIIYKYFAGTEFLYVGRV